MATSELSGEQYNESETDVSSIKGRKTVFGLCGGSVKCFRVLDKAVEYLLKNME